MAVQSSAKDSLEEEMSRFEQEILGTSSTQPPPQPLMGAPPLMRTRPLLPEGGAILITPDSKKENGLLQPPGQGSQTHSGLLKPPDAPRPLFQPIGGPATGPSNNSQPLIPNAPLTNVSSTVNAPTPGFVPRQALHPPGAPRLPSSVNQSVTARPPVPLMGTSNAPSSQGGPRLPTPSLNTPPHGLQSAERIGKPGQNAPFGQNGPPGGPRPDFNRHPGMVPPGQPSRFPPPPPPGVMPGHPRQPPPMFPPPNITPFPNALMPTPLFSQQHSPSGVAIPPTPDVNSYSSKPSAATPLPMAIAQALAGATSSSGMSASGSGAGVSLDSVPIPTKPPKKKKDPKKLRVGGGQVWEDPSLDDWDPDDFRIFVGDLGNDVNDDTLARNFSRFSSFLKAKVIRDRYTKKTKGYGFVSFKDPKDFMQAMREVNGRYIGNRPVKLRKSTWKDRSLLVVKKKEKEKKRLGFK